MREIRGCVVSRWEGGRILSADYSQGELRLMAMFWGEESLLSGYRREAEEGVPSDVHTDVARGLGIERHVAKTLNYVAAYFAAENQVAKQIGCGRKEAKDFLVELEKKLITETYFTPPTIAEADEKEVEAAAAKKPRVVPTLVAYAEDVIERRFDATHSDILGIDPGLRPMLASTETGHASAGADRDVVRCP